MKKDVLFTINVERWIARDEEFLSDLEELIDAFRDASREEGLMFGVSAVVNSSDYEDMDYQIDYEYYDEEFGIDDIRIMECADMALDCIHNMIKATRRNHGKFRLCCNK